MRSLRYVAFLLVVFATTVAFCSDRNDGPKASPVSQNGVASDANGIQVQVAPDANQTRQFTVPQNVRTADGPLKQRAKVLVPQPWPYNIEAGNVCYFIRSYIMKREGNSGATHLERVETCTPRSQIRMKTTIQVVPAIAR